MEEFKPIPVKRYQGLIGRIRYSIRLLVDLQLLTITRFLKPRLYELKGSVLDVGCGEMPFRSLLTHDIQYTGIDVPEAISFGMSNHKDIIAFDGNNIPFSDNKFNVILCTEVLEHVISADRLVDEMYRVLHPAGVLVVTVPFSARVHHKPYDFHRFTRYRLAILFSKFYKVEIIERGNDISVIANKLIVLCARLVRPRKSYLFLLNIACFAFVMPLTLLFLLVAHISLLFGIGSKDDPLGYGIVAYKDK